jgi:hypothetical protein|tara:strand:+ start:1891 stop:2442 length:552 start_codon:yes stop_codon:yes gene_type:complete
MALGDMIGKASAGNRAAGGGVRNLGQGQLTNTRAGVNTGMWAGSEANRILKGDVEAMKADKQGWSESEIDNYANAQKSAAAMQGQAQQAELNRQALAAGGTWSGERAEATRNVNKDVTEAGAQAYAEGYDQSEAQKEERRAETLQRLEAQQDRALMNVKTGPFGTEAHGQRAESLMGMLGMFL